VVSSCIQDDEFDIPEIEIQSVDIPQDRVLSIGSLSAQLEQEMTTNGNDILTFQTDNDSSNDLFVVGYVISNDASGNFFEELVLQDTPSNPTAGVKVLIDVNPLFNTYQFGRKVFIRLDGLSVALDSGVLSLGIREGNGVEKISEAAQSDFLLRDDEVEDIIPLDITISQFTSEKTNLYIRLNSVQFNRNQALGDDRLTFAAEADDQFDGERILESCTSGATTTFSTSTFADFKGQLLPQGSGSITGLLTFNFFGEDFNVVVNDLSTIDLNGERCDPSEISCGIAIATGANVLFSDFFETQQVNNPINGNGWTNYAESGTQTWEAYSSGGTNASLGTSARIGSFMSGDTSTIGWLATPQINFDAQDGETLNFMTSNSFSDGSTLEVLFSNDWDGVAANIPNATWDIVADAFIVQDSDFFGDWFPSGNVDLSCVSGQGYIAWKYVGSGVSDFDGTYELDEIKLESN
jgi:hypothetical protein